MSVFEYYFYPPNKPQFFFPKKEFKIYQKFYKPFSTKSKVFWFFFKNSFLIRSFFKINESNIPLPISTIKKIIGLKEASFFFNIGTGGIEQKATIIADNGKVKRFLKFAQNPVSKQLVANEAKILKELENQNKLKTARVLNYIDNNDFTYVLTDVISGKKASFTKLNDKVFDLLCVLGGMYPLKHNKKGSVFSHGDFCPWNMLVENNQELVLIDWEMAGFKPLGHDLFTFIFQTNFLINEKKEIKDILAENTYWIKKYFNYFNIESYDQYLYSFVVTKMNKEKDKLDKQLYSKYKQIVDLYE